MSTTETGSRNTGTRQCAFCKHWYINPCDDERKASCANYLHLTTTKPKIARVKLNPPTKAKAKKGKRK